MDLFIASGEKQTLLLLSSSALYWDKTSTATADGVSVSWIPPVPWSREQLQAVSCCCFFPLLLHETGMRLARSAGAQPALPVLSQLCPAALENGELVIPLHPAEVLSKGQLCYCNAVQRWEVGTSLRVPPLRKRLSSALWEPGGTPSPNESWESGCVKSTCQGKPLTRPEWVSKRNFQALNSFPALTRVLLISALLYSFCHLTQSFHWLLCGCLEG